MLSKILEDIATIPSFTNEEHTLTKYIEEKLKLKGCNVNRVGSPERYNLVVDTTDRESCLTIFANLDSKISFSELTGALFEVHEYKDRIEGLGLQNSKLGLALALNTLFKAVEKGLPLRACFGIDGMGHFRGAHELFNYGAFNNSDLVLTGNVNGVSTASSPFIACFGRNGILVYDLIFRSPPAHAVSDVTKRDAILLAAQFTEELENLSESSSFKGAEYKVVPTAINAETSVYSLVDECCLRCEVKTIPEIPHDYFLNFVKSYAAKKDLDVHAALVARKYPYPSSFLTDTKHHYANLLHKEFLIPYAIEHSWSCEPGSENVIVKRSGLPVVSIAPVTGRLENGREWVDLKSLTLAGELYFRMAEFFANIRTVSYKLVG